MEGLLTHRWWYFDDTPAPHADEPYCLSWPLDPCCSLRPRHGVCAQNARIGETYGTLLRRMRRTTGCTQAELAEVAGLCPNTIGNLETHGGWRPWRSTHECVVAGLQACGVSPVDLQRFEQAYDTLRHRSRSHDQRRCAGEGGEK